MSGIYLHIPFCKQACYYCNFHFSTTITQKEKMIAALIKEIGSTKQNISAHRAAQDFLSPIARENSDGTIDTIYFGGGTPSLLSGEEIRELFEAMYQNYEVNINAEITLEANPDDITEKKLNEWRSAGINRLSIGIQSFNDEELIWMNRAHTAYQALHCIELVKDAGFVNFSVDLIYGTPLLNDDEWKKNVNSIIKRQVPHISCYALTVEPSTALQKMIGQKKQPDVDPEKQARQFVLLMQWMMEAGYEHYEISNFALPGYRSRHNSSYWQGKPYIGIGPSAHSFNGNTRKWNVSNNSLYIQSLLENRVYFEEERLSAIQQLNEYIMTSLRTMEGLDLHYVKERFGEDASYRLQAVSNKYILNSKITNVNSKLLLTDNGKLFADGIAADLFF